MVAVDSPYLSFQKAHPKDAETRPRISRLGGALREPRSEQESLPTISNLCSWNGLLTHLPAGFIISAIASRVRAEELRHTLSDLVFPRSSCIIPAAGLHGPERDGSLPAPFRRTVKPFGFPEISLFPLRAPASRAAFQGALPSSGSCAPRPEHLKYIAQAASVQALPALSPGAPTHPTFTPQRRRFHRQETLQQKAVGPPPLPGRWPSDPYRPVTGLRKCPLRSGPAGCASMVEVSNHRWTFVALLRVAMQGLNNLHRAIVIPNLFTCQILTKW